MKKSWFKMMAWFMIAGINLGATVLSVICGIGAGLA